MNCQVSSAPGVCSHPLSSQHISAFQNAQSHFLSVQAEGTSQKYKPRKDEWHGRQMTFKFNISLTFHNGTVARKHRSGVRIRTEDLAGQKQGRFNLSCSTLHDQHCPNTANERRFVRDTFDNCASALVSELAIAHTKTPLGRFHRHNVTKRRRLW